MMAISKTNTMLTIGALALGSILGLAHGADADEADGAPAPTSAAVVESLRLEVPFQGGAAAFLDLGKKGLGPGDLFVSSDLPVTDAATGKRVGSMDGWEIILSAHHDGSVAGETVLRLADGNVLVDGMVRHTDDPNVFAVTGGTGSYVGVGGTMTVVRENTRRKVVIMRLDIVG
jgi:hypothetical protein